MHIPWLEEEDLYFPPTTEALDSPNGLLAAGGDLSSSRLIRAYAQGIFPWFSEEEPIMWWSPSPRCVIFPERFYASKSLKKLARKNTFNVTYNQHFPNVIEECSKERADQNGTWITEEMKEAYIELHHQGFAHSVEVMQGDMLVGGLYGVAIGSVFYGESMFSRQPNTSKLALYALSQWMLDNQGLLIDCQVTSDHLLTLGAEELDRVSFEEILKENLTLNGLARMSLPN
jgi:leucyl/phenylalanyl-tRNA--protein transferase